MLSILTRRNFTLLFRGESLRRVGTNMRYAGFPAGTP